MAFGQPSGPPASAKQVQELLGLLHDAGHSDFRDARGPMGFTQRQSAGRFTRDEATAFIDRLLEEEPDERGPVETGRFARPAPAGHAMTRMPAEHLAAELRRRGWTVIEPEA